MGYRHYGPRGFFFFPPFAFFFGLFVLFINAFLLYVVGMLVRSFRVESFWAAFWGGLVISLVSMAAHALLGTPDSRVRIRSRRRGDDGTPRPPGNGPVIDV